VFRAQAYQTFQYVVLRGGVFLGKWRSAFAGSSDGKMNGQSAYALNILYIPVRFSHRFCVHLSFLSFLLYIAAAFNVAHLI
jgi:hypothetical protein